MCGIIYIKRKDGRPAYKSVLKRYRAQQHRGKEGYGYVAIQDNKIISYKRAPTEHEIIKQLEKETASEILFHHRQPTGSPNIEELAHPIMVDNEMLDHQYLIAHNGVIRNHEKLKGEHELLGFKYNTEIVKGFSAVSSGKMYTTGSAWNDSEALAVETALALDGKQKQINAEGAAAVIGLKVKGKHVIERFFYRNTMNPLNYHEDKIMLAITSAGIGEKVASTYVYKLKPEGGYELYRNDKALIFTPWGYKYEDKGSNVKYWDEDLRAWKNDKADNHTILLPSPPSPHFEDDERDYGIAMGFIKEDEDEEPHTRSIEEVLKDIADIPLPSYYSHTPLVRGYTDTTLWTEYDKTIGAESTLKKEIAVLDEKSSEYIDNAVIRERGFLQITLDKTKKYQEALSAEITIREAKEGVRVIPA